MKKIFPVLSSFLLILLAACADPRDTAEADAIRIQAQQSALDAEQQRAHQETLYAIEETERQAISEATVQAEKARLAAQTQAEIERLQAENNLEVTRAAAKQTFLRWLSVSGSAALAIFLLSAAIGAGWGALGSGKAAGDAAALQASLIRADEATRLYPLVLRYLGQGRYSLTNPGTGEVIMLDTRRSGDRQLIAATGAVQLAGTLAAEARKSNDAASIAMIRPPIVGAKGIEVDPSLKEITR